MARIRLVHATDGTLGVGLLQAGLGVALDRPESVRLPVCVKGGHASDMGENGMPEGGGGGRGEGRGGGSSGPGARMARVTARINLLALERFLRCVSSAVWIRSLSDCHAETCASQPATREVDGV